MGRFGNQQASPLRLLAQRNISPADTAKSSGNNDDYDTLLPGEQRLQSFSAPLLVAGPAHTIRVQQTVNGKPSDSQLELVAERKFSVRAPQFSLPDGTIHSVYPPPGYSESRRVLPHIVLSDPHIPWERFGNPLELGDPKKRERHRTPWLGLLSFTEDELRLTSEELASVFSQVPMQEGRKLQQNSNYATKIAPCHIPLLRYTTFPDLTKDFREAQREETDVILLKRDVFRKLFSQYNEQNEPVSADQADTSAFAYLAHVVSINAKGMATAEPGDGSPTVQFSTLFSHRTGPLDRTSPTPVTVHLLSLEGVSGIRLPLDSKYVSLISLHSWTYTCQPPGKLDTTDAFNKLRDTLGLLRRDPPSSLLNRVSPSSSTDPVKDRLSQRLSDGYSLLRYRTQTGEPTVAFYRGPYTPTAVGALPMPKCSNSGIDLQIVDRTLGIMDITYSSAWQLGRTLAIADSNFTAALARFKAAIHALAMDSTKIEVAKLYSASHPRMDVLEALPKTIENLRAVHSASEVQEGVTSSITADSSYFEPGDANKRWFRRKLSRKETPNLSWTGEEMKARYQHHANEAALALSMASLPPDTKPEIYNGANTPKSTDWQVLVGSLMDMKHLLGIPAHYYISDPTHLPPESLRFFSIDDNWTDALIDGALSLANHMGEDKDRVAIKVAFNRFLTETTHTVPVCGFLLRSDLVSIFPDLKVSTGLGIGDNPIKRHEIVTDGLMLCLFDRDFGCEGLRELWFTQPPHQERFAVGESIHLEEGLTVGVKQQYTVQYPSTGSKAIASDSHTFKRQDHKNIFIWGSESGKNDIRLLRLPYYAKYIFDTLMEKNKDTQLFVDTVPTSALLARQMTDPVYRLKIELGKSKALETLKKSFLGTMEADLSAAGLLTSLISSTVDKPDLAHPKETDALDLQQLPSAASIGRVAPPILVADNLVPHLPTIPDVAYSTEESTIEILPFKPQSVALESNIDRPAGPADFHVKIFSMSAADKPSSSRIVWVGDGLEQDLIFAIRCENNNWDKQLVEFKICIPMGISGGLEKAKNLLEKYEGPGAAMLSNLRFNVLVQRLGSARAKNWTLELRVIPRTAQENKGVRVNKITELSFRLSLAAPVGDNRVVENITYTWKYAGAKKWHTGTEKLEVRVRNKS
ncbi:hypothetical protein BJ508DRAFT_45177 [Ascobolus immersus RN42]|uniref:Uncharacterized protein n=1 Tax=Ascobolus immersus RN42 TaxID=1160509 RepID=A0A3N4HLN6_ASCIM|nr:hypothetical protein BJ508DRAFT_45177 [Ascobolus immersus RN42]